MATYRYQANEVTGATWYKNVRRLHNDWFL